MSPPRENPETEQALTSSRHQRRALLHSRDAGSVATRTTQAPPKAAEAPPGHHEMSAHEVLELLDAPPRPRRPDRRSDGDHHDGDNLPVPLGDDATFLGADPGSTLARGAPALVRPAGLRHRLHRRRYGVAPFVRPSARRSRRKRRRDYRHLGFVELTPEKLRLRHRVLPRTVLGVAALVLACGVGAAFSGAAFYAYYDWRTTQTELKTAEFAETFEQTFVGAQEELQLTRNQAIEQVNQGLDPLRVWAGDANAVAELPAKVGGGVFFVRTLDAAGQPSAGSAFVVSSTPEESLFLTSFSVVSAAQASPGPPLTVEKGGERIPVLLMSWDAEHDLALLRAERGNLPQLEWAPDDVRARAPGSRLYAMSGSGGQGATASPGLAIDESEVGLRHNTPLAAEFRGGPLVNSGGQVLAVTSLAYRPTGLDNGEIPFAPWVTDACAVVLRCPAAVTATAAPTPAPAPAPDPSTPLGATEPGTATTVRAGA